MSDRDYSIGLEDLAGLITFRVGAWHDFGYAEPPAPECKAIPPLGERSAEAIKAGHEAIGTIDELLAQLHRLREQLVSELRRNDDINMERAGALLARLQAERDAAEAPEYDDGEPGAAPFAAVPRLRRVTCTRTVMTDGNPEPCGLPVDHEPDEKCPGNPHARPAPEASRP